MVYQAYWSIFLKELSVSFREAPRCILDRTDKSKHGGSWLPGSVLNIAECCLSPTTYPRKNDDSVAIVWRDESHDDAAVNSMTLKELREQVMYVLSCIIHLQNFYLFMFLAYQLHPVVVVTQVPLSFHHIKGMKLLISFVALT